jgi:3-deoxy-D-manno-octulosonic-acid transferase
MRSGSIVGSTWAGATTLVSPALRLLLRYRAARGKEITARLAERRGVSTMPRPAGRLVWLHAASVGETISILPVLTVLIELDPEVNVMLTTGTVTSANLLGQRLHEMGLAARVSHCFAPLDVPRWVRRFLDHWRPDVAGFVESELWPNILIACRTRAIPTMLINARMSVRSHAAWSHVPWAARFVLGGFDRVHARDEEAAVRFRALGAKKVEVMGDLKLAASILPVDPIVLQEMAERLAGRPVFLAASTHPGEETLIRKVHNALRSSRPGLLTIIAPRHPERGSELAATLHAPSRRQGQPPPDEGMWIADTIGELGLWYRLCQVAFIGRSLTPPGGGQNPLEPARLGCAIATGPLTENFASHIALLRAANALEVTSDVSELIRFAGAMLDDPKAREEMGTRAKAAVKAPETLPHDTALALLDLIFRRMPSDVDQSVT